MMYCCGKNQFFSKIFPQFWSNGVLLWQKAIFFKNIHKKFRNFGQMEYCCGKKQFFSKIFTKNFEILVKWSIVVAKSNFFQKYSQKISQLWLNEVLLWQKAIFFKNIHKKFHNYG